MVFLFPTYIAPEAYYEHWRSLGVTINELGGVLGGEPYVIDSVLEELVGGREKWEIIQLQTYNVFREEIIGSLKRHAFTEEVIHRLTPPLEDVNEGTWPTTAKELIEAAEKERRKQVAAGLADGKGVAAFRRSVAKQHLLRFSADMEKPIVYVSGGGTPVWDEILEKLVKAAIEKGDELKFAIVLSYFPQDFKDWPDKSGKEAQSIQKKFAKFGIEALEKPAKDDKPIEMRIPVSGGTTLNSMRFVRDIENGTHQEIFYGTDLIVTRAGGGTANDSIATRTPLVCVEEPGHWQVEAIRKNLTEERFARSVTLEAFRNNPLGVIEHELIDEREKNERLRRRLYSVKNRAEQAAAQAILDYFLDPESYYDDLVRELIFH